MSQVAIRAALEAAVKTLPGNVPTNFENESFVPPALSTAYERVNIMWAKPVNNEFGGGSYSEEGIMQISLMYPLQKGTTESGLRVEAIRALFKRGATFTNSGIKVTVMKTAEANGGKPDEGRWYIPVKIPFHAFIS